MKERRAGSKEGGGTGKPLAERREYDKQRAAGVKTEKSLYLLVRVGPNKIAGSPRSVPELKQSNGLHGPGHGRSVGVSSVLVVQEVVLRHSRGHVAKVDVKRKSH